MHRFTGQDGSEEASSGERLGKADALDLGRQIAAAAESNTPLAPALRALADESRGRRKRLLLKMARRLEAGESAQTVLAGSDSPLPPMLCGVIAAGIRTGDTSGTLERFIEHSQRFADLTRSCKVAVAYPLFLFVSVAALFYAIVVYLTPQFKTLYRDFGIELAPATILLFEISNFIIDFTPFLAAVLIFALATYPVLSRFPAGERLLCKTPLFGPLFHYSALSGAFGFLSLLISRKTSAPDAVRMTADAVSERWIARALRRAADDVERGVGLGEALSRHAPASLGVVVSWGEKRETLHETLGVLSDVAAERAENQGELVRSLVPSITLLFVGFIVFYAIIAALLPLIQLLKALGQ